MRVLLIEDELDAARLTASLISQAGFDVDQAHCLSAAREAVEGSNYDLLLLDRRLPDGDGLSLMSLARELRPGIRVMMLTAMDDMADKVSSFDLGADDYVTKPFQGEELVARIRACVRRPGSGALKPIVVGALSFDLTTRDVRIAGKNRHAASAGIGLAQFSFATSQSRGFARDASRRGVFAARRRSGQYARHGRVAFAATVHCVGRRRRHSHCSRRRLYGDGVA